MVRSFFISILLCSALSFAQEVNIIPQPVQVIKQNGNFIITPQTSLVVANKEDIATAAFLNKYLSDYYGFELAIVQKASNNFIKFKSWGSSSNQYFRNTFAHFAVLKSFFIFPLSLKPCVFIMYS